MRGLNFSRPHLKILASLVPETRRQEGKAEAWIACPSIVTLRLPMGFINVISSPRASSQRRFKVFNFPLKFYRVSIVFDAVLGIDGGIRVGHGESSDAVSEVHRD